MWTNTSALRGGDQGKFQKDRKLDKEGKESQKRGVSKGPEA